MNFATLCDSYGWREEIEDIDVRLLWQTFIQVINFDSYSLTIIAKQKSEYRFSSKSCFWLTLSLSRNILQQVAWWYWHLKWECMQKSLKNFCKIHACSNSFLLTKFCWGILSSNYIANRFLFSIYSAKNINRWIIWMITNLGFFSSTWKIKLLFWLKYFAAWFSFRWRPTQIKRYLATQRDCLRVFRFQIYKPSCYKYFWELINDSACRPLWCP